MIASIRVGPGPEAAHAFKLIQLQGRVDHGAPVGRSSRGAGRAPFDFSGALGPESESTRSARGAQAQAVHRPGARGGGQRGGLSLTAWSQPSRTLRVTVELETNL